MTNEQLQTLADKRLAYDAAVNNGWDTPALTEYPALCAEHGLNLIEAEEVTWPLIAEEMFQ